MKNATLSRLSARHPRAAAACAVLAALAACGGGPGGGGPGAVAGGAGEPAQGPVAITMANARPVAAEALDSATSIDAARSASNYVLSDQVAADAPAQAPALRLAQAAASLAARSGDAGRVLGARMNETMPCTHGGSMTVSGSMAGAGGFAVGDSATLVATGCREAMGEGMASLSGSMTMSVTAGGFGPSAAFPRRVVMTLHASGFSVTAGSQTSTSTGDLTVDLTQNSADAMRMLLTGSALASEVAGPGGTRSFTMREYRHAVVIAGGSTSCSMSADVESGTGRPGTAGMTYHVSTPAALVTGPAGDFTGGALRVEGHASSLLLTVTGTNLFQLQVDADGDGSLESGTATTLQELRNQL